MLDTIRAIPDELRSIVAVLFALMVESGLAPEMNPDAGSILDGFAGAMDLIPVVLLVLVASLVIGIVQRLRG